jgi:hypothetical protein
MIEKTFPPAWPFQEVVNLQNSKEYKYCFNYLQQYIVLMSFLQYYLSYLAFRVGFAAFRDASVLKRLSNICNKK